MNVERRRCFIVLPIAHDEAHDAETEDVTFEWIVRLVHDDFWSCIHYEQIIEIIKPVEITRNLRFDPQNVSDKIFFLLSPKLFLLYPKSPIYKTRISILQKETCIFRKFTLTLLLAEMKMFSHFRSR